MLSDTQRATLLARLTQARRPTPDGGPRGPLVPLSNGGGRRPMFLVHAVGGTVFGYAQLARALADAFRVYGVEADGLDARSRPAASLEEMVVRYTRAIQEAQPTGPYTLGGWSLGGLVAFEIAQRLQRHGERVDRLVLVDTACRPSRPRDEDLRRIFVVDVVRSLGWDGVAEFTADDDAGFDRLTRRLTRPDADPDRVRADLERRFDLFDAHLRIVDGYGPAGRVRASTLIACAADSPNSALDWADAVDGPVRELHLAGDHYRCLMQPYAREIAAALLHL